MFNLHVFKISFLQLEPFMRNFVVKTCDFNVPSVTENLEKFYFQDYFKFQIFNLVVKCKFGPDLMILHHYIFNKKLVTSFINDFISVPPVTFLNSLSFSCHKKSSN